MSHSYTRTFINQDEVEAFISGALNFNYRQYPNIISKIVNAETALSNTDVKDFTLNSTFYREREFKSPDARWGLRKKIIEELLSLSRVENDETIRLGTGGAMPVSGIQSDFKAFIIIGLPASGKSTVANNIAEKFGAIILDPDYAKRKLPEFYVYPAGASIVHDESSAITSGFTEDNDNLESVYAHSLLKGYNMIIPTIGHDIENIKILAEFLNKAKYETHLILVSLRREEATKRAIKRLHDSNRYIPLGLIFDVYANNPMLTYYLLRTKCPTLFSSYGAISTNSPGLSCIDLINDSPCKDFKRNESIFI